MKDRRLSLRCMYAAALMAACCLPLSAQDRLKTMPGYDQYQKMAREIPGSVKLGALNVRWKDDGSSFEYAWDGKRYVYDLATRQATVAADAAGGIGGGRGGRGGGGAPERGRQFDTAESPDKQLKAFYKDRIVWLSAGVGCNAVALSTEGCDMTRV
jgi:dipeptidyl-peptidase-4